MGESFPCIWNNRMLKESQLLELNDFYMARLSDIKRGEMKLKRCIGLTVTGFNKMIMAA